MAEEPIDPETVEEVTREREALQELIQSEGWRVFATKVLREWRGTGYVQRMKAAIVAGGAEPRVVDRTGDEIEKLLAWPATRVDELTGVSE